MTKSFVACVIALVKMMVAFVALTLEPAAAQDARGEATVKPPDGREAYSVVALKDGRLLFFGGGTLLNPQEGTIRPIAEAQIYDPSRRVWASAGSMAVPRCGALGTLMQDGEVLITGGTTCVSARDRSKATLALPAAELFDPVNGRFTRVGDMAVGRMSHAGIPLTDGTVLITGGAMAFYCGCPTMNSAELYEPRTRSFRRTGDMNIGRACHWTRLTAKGDALVTGGYTKGGPSSADAAAGRDEVYEPSTGEFSLLESTNIGHHCHYL